MKVCKRPRALSPSLPTALEVISARSPSCLQSSARRYEIHNTSPLDTEIPRADNKKEPPNSCSDSWRNAQLPGGRGTGK